MLSTGWLCNLVYAKITLVLQVPSLQHISLLATIFAQNCEVSQGVRILGEEAF